MTFVERKISVTFSLGPVGQVAPYAYGTFASTGKNTVTLEGLRIQCDISKVVVPGMGQAHLRIHGLTLSLLNDLSAIIPVKGDIPQVRFNQLIINAGDDIAGMAKVFDGNTTMSTAIDMAGAPDSILEVQSAVGSYAAVQSIPVSTFPGTTSGKQILATLAAMDPALSFEYSGDDFQLDTPYLPGSRRDQILSVVEAGGVECTLDNGALCVWNRYGHRPANSIPLVSPATGLVGYPTNIGIGAMVKTVFNPNINVGGLVNIQSSLKFATGTFKVFEASHEIDSQLPGGRWFTTFHAYPYYGQ